MAGDTKMGITIQTMDTKKFDYGLILDQTPAPGFDIPDPETCDVSRLLGLVSERGAEMLVNAIRNRIFIPPLKPAVQPSLETVAPLRHAPKITPEDRHIDWSSWDWEKIRRYQRVVGPLWNTAAVSNGSPDSTMPSERKRVIITKMEALDPTAAGIAPSDVEPGRPFATSDCDPKEGGIYVFTNDGTLVLIEEMKVQGERAAPAYRAALKAKLIPPLPTESSFCTFHAPLL
jgi:methionyl-tRNA formyltransferase